MPVRQSIRISIRWLPDQPSEPTDTLVFGVGHWFMDLRVTKADLTIDWAMAGVKEIVSQEPCMSPISHSCLSNNCNLTTYAVRCRWIHTIDSRGSSDPDEGDFEDLPNGDSLEKGSMPCPEKGGAVKAYEEVWRVVSPLAGSKRAWILQSVKDGGKTFIGRIGGTFMAMMQDDKGGFGARRDEWDGGEARWKTKYSIGLDVPSVEDEANSDFNGEERWKEGEIVEVGGAQYTVRASEAI